jgi:DNA-binding XRE family transcriptional regulator
VNRSAELSRARAFTALSDEDCFIWLGIGLATLERIEAGEVVPSAETARRIERFLQTIGGRSAVGRGGVPFLPANPAPPFTHCGGASGAGGAPAGTLLRRARVASGPEQASGITSDNAR